IKATDQNGGQWIWAYDDLDRLILRQDCVGQRTAYQYNEQGDLAVLVDAAGGVTRFAYDPAHNLLQLTTPDNGTSRWKYDRLGRNRVSIDPKGNLRRRHFDLLGNVIQVDEPDGNHRYLDHDPEGNVIRARDRHHEVEFSYQGMDKLHLRRENGRTVQFLYDTEEQLIGIRNEQQRLYEFDLDENGQVEIESGFDEVKRYYQRDEAGRVSSVLRASGLETRYQYDAMDRIIQVDHRDKDRVLQTETFAYRADGELMAAQNLHSQVKFERDLLGRVVKEWEGAHWIESKYDQRSRRFELRSRLGAEVAITRDAMGEVSRILARMEDGKWEAHFKHDLLGRETKRSFTGGVLAQWERDQLGRPVQQQVFTAGASKKAQKTRSYTWGVNDRLQSLQVDEQLMTRFGHDEVGNLAWAQYGSGERENRLPDEIGNLFKRQDRRDRRYGPAGQLLEAEGTRYHYDPEGNLISKVLPDDSSWYYQWYPSGLMKSAERPDGQVVEFTYDPLGRRLSKRFAGSTTRWIWDGNVPLHEWEETEELLALVTDQDPSQPAGIQFVEKQAADQGNFLDLGLSDPSPQEQLSSTPAWKDPEGPVTTWLFEPESFAPLAKLIGGQAFSIVTDHLGTPVAMYDGSGRAAWSAETSIYGALRDLQGPREACPFRYPGQYEDVETGLYYNRFRYYDP
ncbi:MAG: RHS domain-containing protein, partial [Bacteroidota bacterium]